MNPQPRASGQVEREAASWIVRRDHGLSHKEEVEFAQWRAVAANAAAFARKEKAWTVLGRAGQAGQTEELLERIRHRVWRRRKQRIMAASAILIIGAMLTVSLIKPHPAAQTIVQRSHIIRPKVETLPDGTIAEVRGDAQIVVKYSAEYRRVEFESGEVHFKVTKNPQRPFIVAVKGVEVRAVGTAFSVACSATELSVLVTEGRVKVEKPVGGEKQRGTTYIDAGSSIAIDTSTPDSPLPPVTLVSPQEFSERLVWRTPKLEFSEVPLSEAVAIINRESIASDEKRVRFVVADESLARLPVSGVIAADSTDTFVRLLQGTLPINAERTGDTVILTKATPPGNLNERAKNP
jgi:transmembrane sensor